MKNRYYDIFIVPEKGSKTKKWTIPSWILPALGIGTFLLLVLGTMMLIDYGFVMSQMEQVQTVRLQNQRLKEQVQLFQNKIEVLQTTMNHIETFTERLRMITNLQDRSTLAQTAKRGAPPALLSLSHAVENTSKKSAFFSVKKKP